MSSIQIVNCTLTIHYTSITSPIVFAIGVDQVLAGRCGCGDSAEGAVEVDVAAEDEDEDSRLFRTAQHCGEGTLCRSI